MVFGTESLKYWVLGPSGLVLVPQPSKFGGCVCVEGFGSARMCLGTNLLSLPCFDSWCMCAYHMYIWTYIYIYTYICIHRYIYIHTYIHAYILFLEILVCGCLGCKCKGLRDAGKKGASQQRALSSCALGTSRVQFSQY